MKPFVIGFMGYAGVGKTTVSQILQTIAPDKIEIASFASPLKKAVKDLFLFSDEQVYGTKEQKEEVDPRWGVSFRTVAQLLGTDCLRNMICKDFHVKRMAAYLETVEKPIVVIDDIRFDGEAELVNQYGICFEVQRPGLPEEKVRHESEYPPINRACGYYVLNQAESIDKLQSQLLSNQSYLANLILEKLR